MNEAVVRARLEACYGRTLPDAFVRLAMWYGGSESRDAAFARRFGSNLLVPAAIFDATAPIPRPDAPTYYTDPPELLAVCGCYTRYGYLDLAPEIVAAEHLTIVESNPNGYDRPVTVMAGDLAGALATLAPEDDDPLAPDLREVFGRAIVRESIGGAFEFPRPTVIPDGYRFEVGYDCTGVLAPAAAFDPIEYVPVFYGDEDDDQRIDAYVERAARSLRDGYPATTILIARDVRTAYPVTGSNEAYEAALSLWIDAARTLDRPSHAASVIDVLQNYRTHEYKKSPIPTDSPSNDGLIERFAEQLYGPNAIRLDPNNRN